MADIEPIQTPSPEPGSLGHTATQGVESQPGRVAPGRTVEERFEAMQRDRNPLLAAAGPLVRCLADLPERMAPAEAERLRERINEELDTFKELAERANIKRAHITASHYAICTALDDVALQHPWGQGWWANHSLLVQHHRDNRGGERVYHVLGRLVESPQEHIALIQLIYLLMSLGFLGRYRKMTDGDLQHRMVRQRLYDILLKHYGAVPQLLSPNCEPAPPGRFRHLRGIPVWMTGLMMFLVVSGLAGWYKYQLLVQQHEVVRQIAAIGNLTPLPVPTTLRLADLLKDEMARGVVAVKEDGQRSTVVFQGDGMFRPGEVDVNQKLFPTLDKVAAEINKVRGKVQVIGHSDNQPVSSARHLSNQALSEARAVVVSQYLASKGVAKGNLEAVGKGDDEPLTDNKTPAARAANRRVEVVVTPSLGPGI